VVSPPRRPPRSIPFPYTTLFRSRCLPQPLGRLGRSVGPSRAAAGEDDLVPAAGAAPRAADAWCVGSWRNLVRPAEPQRESRSVRSEEHTSELQSRENLVCRLLLD